MELNKVNLYIEKRAKAKRNMFISLVFGLVCVGAFAYLYINYENQGIYNKIMYALIGGFIIAVLALAVSIYLFLQNSNKLKKAKKSKLLKAQKQNLENSGGEEFVTEDVIFEPHKELLECAEVTTDDLKNQEDLNVKPEHTNELTGEPATPKEEMLLSTIRKALIAQGMAENEFNIGYCDGRHSAHCIMKVAGRWTVFFYDYETGNITEIEFFEDVKSAGLAFVKKFASSIS